jgi:hypothetical protein
VIFAARHLKIEDIYNVHTTGDFNCQFCSKSYEKKYSLREHLRTTHENDESACEFCSKIFQNSRYLKCHVRDVHCNEENSVCDQCKNTFENKNILKSHIREEHRNNWISCDACKKMYNSKTILEKHIETSCPSTKRENEGMKKLTEEVNGSCNKFFESTQTICSQHKGYIVSMPTLQQRICYQWTKRSSHQYCYRIFKMLVSTLSTSHN